MPKVAWKVMREVTAPQVGTLTKYYVVERRNWTCKAHKAGEILTQPCLNSCLIEIAYGKVDAERASAEWKQAARDYALSRKTDHTVKGVKTKSQVVRGGWDVEPDEQVATYVKSLAKERTERRNDRYTAEAKLGRGAYGDDVIVQLALYTKALNLYWMEWAATTGGDYHGACKYCKGELWLSDCYPNYVEPHRAAEQVFVAKAAAHYYVCPMLRQWKRKDQAVIDRQEAAYATYADNLRYLPVYAGR